MIGARILVIAAGLLGLSGVLIAAAGTHAGGGELAGIASEFLLVHATVVLGLGLALRLGLSPRWPWLIVAGVMIVGTSLFSGDLSLLAFGGSRPVRMIAPIGGTLLIAAWVGIMVVGALPRGDRPGND